MYGTPDHEPERVADSESEEEHMQLDLLFNQEDPDVDIDPYWDSRGEERSSRAGASSSQSAVPLPASLDEEEPGPGRRPDGDDQGNQPTSTTRPEPVSVQARVGTPMDS